MKNNFTTGDRVEAIDDDFKGEVIAISTDIIWVKSEEGIELSFYENELILQKNMELNRLNISEFKKIEQKRKPVKKYRSKQGNMTILEIDLHIEKLVDKPQRRKDIIVLDYQLNHAKYQIEFAISKGIQKVIFIHGVGEGILRAELETLVSRYERITYCDADYSKYGLGAMEIFIKQN